ncbi:MAG: 50S ribosomal protein L21 [Minwuia sp.]|uniref:50S ribosomal protein L21 n=1 Tax=Minwuia sp. TaxID=2493630 RepID=UPI003A8BE086
MHAVIKTGGKQYRVAEGDVLQIETLQGEPGSTVAFDEVLAVGDGADMKVGTPLVDGAKVEAEILDHTRGEKIIIFKKKRRQGYRRKLGHRQNLTVVRIGAISA